VTKKVLVTAALPYANGPLHLGHIRSTYLPADIYARYNRLIGNEVLYVCASDEHGTPIVAAAEKAKKTPKEFVDYYHERDEKEFAQLGFSLDIFHRTSSAENKETTQHFFLQLQKNGHIYQKEVEQPYCENCKRFLPDRFVVGTCPHCKSEKQYSDYCDNCGTTLRAGEILDAKCITCGKTPIKRTTRHYFLKLSGFSDKLKTWLTGNKRLQSEVTNYVLNWIHTGLQDWDISRDLNWGVPVPNEKDMVFYVWFDAPIEYISATKAASAKWADFWKGKPDDTEIVHFIGKDIIYHHFLFWPAMLMGVGDGFRTPDSIPTRGYLNLEGRKFSKSKNWFVSLEDFLSSFQPDYLRYYETAVTPFSVQDADFIWKDFQEKINNELVACFGNFVHRELVLIKKLNGGEVPAPENLDDTDKRLLARIGEVKDIAGMLISEFKFKEAQEEIFHLVADFNKYLSDRQPWKEKDKRIANNTLYVSSRGISAMIILLNPFLPHTSEKLAGMLGVEKKHIFWHKIEDELIKPGTKIEEPKPLFEKVSDEKIEELEGKLVK